MTREQAIDILASRADGIRSMPDQRSTSDQLRDLERVAVMMGMYDASDSLRVMLERRSGPTTRPRLTLGGRPYSPAKPEACELDPALTVAVDKEKRR